jgi:hypothetical protein
LNVTTVKPSLAGSGRIVSVVWSAILAFLILAFGQGVWAALLINNLKTSLAVPWCAVVTAFVLWLMWNYPGWQMVAKQYIYFSSAPGKVLLSRDCCERAKWKELL